MDGGYSRGVRLDLAQFALVEHSQAFQAILASPFIEGRQARTFFLIGCNHHFVANVVSYRMHLAKLNHLTDAAHCQARALGSGFVKQAAVKNTAVVPALVKCHRRFLLQNGDASTGKPLLQAIGRGQPNNSPTHDRDAKTHLVIIAAIRELPRRDTRLVLLSKGYKHKFIAVIQSPSAASI
jgi:hypothetical protein